METLCLIKAKKPPEGGWWGWLCHAAMFTQTSASTTHPARDPECAGGAIPRVAVLFSQSQSGAPGSDALVDSHVFMLRIDNLAKIENLARMSIMNVIEAPSGVSAINRAIDALGGITSMARALNLRSHAVVHQWRLTRVPAEHCPAIERVTNGLVRCEELRPDVAWDVLRNPQLIGQSGAPAIPQARETA